MIVKALSTMEGTEKHTKKETTANDLYHNSTKRLIWLSTTRENVVQKWREK